MSNEHNKRVSVGVGYLAGFVIVCLVKGFWYGVGLLFAMKLFGVEL